MLPFLTSTYLRLGLAIGLVAVVALMGWRVSAWKSAHEALPGVRQALEAERACSDGSECLRRVQAAVARQAVISNEVTADYERELASLRNRPAERRIIRVCRATDPGDVHDPGTAGASDGAGPGAGVVHGAAELDTRPLRDLARDADELAARLRALQQWNAALAERPAGENLNQRHD